MNNKYVLRFEKTGYSKYTSHLDLLRFFKRMLRKSGILLSYSKGFNPHPKMAFAQPLSLGYSSDFELFEFETDIPYDVNDMEERFKTFLPEGINLVYVRILDESIKSLPAACDYATYEVTFPSSVKPELCDRIDNYLSQEIILALKKQKKDKSIVEVNIKDKIRELSAYKNETNQLVLNMKLDSGSQSNLSPELVIQSFVKFFDLDVERYSIEVKRTGLGFLEFNDF